MLERITFWVMRRIAPGQPDDVDIDTLVKLVGNQRRRHVIHYLDHVEPETELGTVSESIAAVENDKDPGLLSAKERKRVYIGLYQAHLDKMDDKGLIDYDKSRGTIERGENYGVARWFTNVAAACTSWSPPEHW